MDTPSLFNKLPDQIFKPLALNRRRLNWLMLQRLHDKFFNDDLHESDYGHPRTEIVRIIEATIENNPGLWLVDEEEYVEPDSPLNIRANQTYSKLVDYGWLHEERHAYQTYVSMPNSASMLLGVLIEIAEGRPLVMTGKLKSMRASLEAIKNDPRGQADTLVELTKDATRFARHLKSIRGSIKELYDQIHGRAHARDVIQTFFDDFLREIFIRDYAAIKTSDNPLMLRNHLLNTIAVDLRSVTTKQALLQGYQSIYEGAQAQLHLVQDLSRLESVFYNVEHQLSAIDTMKVRYEKRVDAVIDYARRIPPQSGKLLRGMIQGLSKALDTGQIETMPFPWTDPEPLAGDRLFQQRKLRTPPKPRPLAKRDIDPAFMMRIRQERLARKACQVDEKGLIALADKLVHDQGRASLSAADIESMQDYFHVLAMHRLASREAIHPGAMAKQYPKFARNYRLENTTEWVETTMFKMTEVHIQHRERRAC